MPKLNHSIELCHNFCWRNRYLMGALTPQERKMFFIPFLFVDPNKKYREKYKINIPFSVVVKFLQCKPDISYDVLAEALREGFHAIQNAAKGDFPYVYNGIKNGNVCFLLQNCDIFTTLDNKLKCTYDLDEISNYSDGRIRDNKPLPLLWYVQCVIEKYLNDYDEAVKNTAYPLCEIATDDNGMPIKLLITIGHEELKAIMGYGKYDYTNIPRDPENPKANRAFLLDFINFMPKIYRLKALKKRSICESDPAQRRWTEAEINRCVIEQKAFEHKYGDTPIEELHRRYNWLWKNTQHRYQPFADKVMKPSIEELNAGNTLHFCLIENQRKSARRTRGQIEAGIPKGKAKVEMSYIRNNYAKKKTDKCVCTGIILDGHGKTLVEEHIYSEIDNYKQRKQGGEHTLCVDLQHWFSRKNNTDHANSDDSPVSMGSVPEAPNKEEESPFFFADHTEEEEPFYVVESYEEEDPLFSVEVPTEEEELPFFDEVSSEDEELPFYVVESYEGEAPLFSVEVPAEEEELPFFDEVSSEDEELPFYVVESYEGEAPLFSAEVSGEEDEVPHSTEDHYKSESSPFRWILGDDNELPFN